MPPRHWSRHPRVTGWDKPSKYRNVPVVIGDRRFASKREATRYLALKEMAREEKITQLVCQPRFELCPAPNRLSFVADFSYVEDGRFIVEEVKGFETEGWRIKQRIFRHQHPEITLRIIR